MPTSSPDEGAARVTSNVEPKGNPIPVSVTAEPTTAFFFKQGAFEIKDEDSKDGPSLSGWSTAGLGGVALGASYYPPGDGESVHFKVDLREVTAAWLRHVQESGVAVPEGLFTALGFDGKPPVTEGVVLTVAETLALRAVVQGDAFDAAHLDTFLKKAEPVWEADLAATEGDEEDES